LKIKAFENKFKVKKKKTNFLLSLSLVFFALAVLPFSLVLTVWSFFLCGLLNLSGLLVLVLGRWPCFPLLRLIKAEQHRVFSFSQTLEPASPRSNPSSREL
jgi:hypothetical protein